jgi:hypothetical protein
MLDTIIFLREGDLINQINFISSNKLIQFLQHSNKGTIIGKGGFFGCSKEMS